MKKLGFVSPFIFFFSTSLFAFVIGTNLEKDDGTWPKGICHASLRDSKTDSATYKCSASIADDHHVVLAAHCVTNPLVASFLSTELKLECPGKLSQYFENVGLHHFQGFEDMKLRYIMGQRHEFAIKDLGVISTDKKIDGPPITFATSSNEIDGLLKLGQCQIFGYSLNSKDLTSAKAEIMHVVQARHGDEEDGYDKSKSLLVHVGMNGGTNGDSGGPLACKDKKGNWIVIGVAANGASMTHQDGQIGFVTFYSTLDPAFAWLKTMKSMTPETGGASGTGSFLNNAGAK